MSQTFEIYLDRIRNTLVDLSRLADANLLLALEALRERDVAKAEAVELEDRKLDELEVVLDEMVVTYIATHGPIATDCRLMLAVSKINTNLERIGDLAVTVARRTKELARDPVFQPFPDILRLGDLALQMVRDAIAAFVSGEYDLALEIIRRDKQIDDLKRSLIDQLLQIMVRDSSMVMRASRLIEVARALERIADHGKSIAEQVYYLIQAKDIRHEKAGA